MLPRQFGLPRPHLLETDADRQRQIVAVKKLFLSIAAECLRKDEAYQLFKSLAKRPTRTRNSDMERLIYAALAEDSNASAPAIAKRLNERYGRKAGQSPEAIAQHIRRLRKERNDHERQMRRANILPRRSLMTNYRP